ncbi:unnamed protein product, partial [Polarella glacialis]
VSVLEAQEVIFGKWLLGWNITDLSHFCSPTGDNGGHKSCDGYYNSVMKTANYTRSASSPWNVLMAASTRASGERMITDCLFAGLHFNKPDWDECLQQEDIMKFIEEALEKIGELSVWYFYYLLIDPRGPGCLTIAEQKLGYFQIDPDSKTKQQCPLLFEVPEGSCIKDKDFAYVFVGRCLDFLLDNLDATASATANATTESCVVDGRQLALLRFALLWSLALAQSQSCEESARGYTKHHGRCCNRFVGPGKTLLCLCRGSEHYWRRRSIGGKLLRR